MLLELRVENLGIIEELLVPLAPGMTAITGETGAGKTLLVDALELLCGGRADPAARVPAGRHHPSGAKELGAHPHPNRRVRRAHDGAMAMN